MKAMKEKFIKTCLFLFLVFPAPMLEAQPLRSLFDLFPNLSDGQIYSIFSENGIRNVFLAGEPPHFSPASNSRLDILSIIIKKKPTRIVEALRVVQYGEKPLNKLDAFNVIGRISVISRYTHPQSKNPIIFQESSRVEGKRNKPIPDPPPAKALPSSDTIYFYLKDASIGNTYLRGDFSDSGYGITYNFTNSQTIWFLIFPVMSAEKFSMILYAEPLKEGMLIYGMAGIDIPDFIAEMFQLYSSINRRVSVFLNWLSDGFKAITGVPYQVIPRNNEILLEKITSSISESILGQ